MDKYKAVGNLGYFLTKFIYYTMRKKVIKKEGYDSEKSYAYGFWHGKLLYTSMMMTNIADRTAVLVSPSKDGEIIATALGRFGYERVRGSSNKDSFRSLVEMIRAMKSGKSGGFAVDGPKGPIYEVKQGIIYSAKKTGMSVVPCGAYCSSKWIFKKAWDKFEIPKPFSKLVYIIGEPMSIPEDADVDEWCRIVGEKIKELEIEAENIAKQKKV